MREMAVLLAVVVFGGCPATRGGLEVKTLVFPTTGLAGYVSYAWAGTASPVGVTQGASGQGASGQGRVEADTEVRRLVETELRVQGLVPSDRAPDCHAFYVMAGQASAWADQIKGRYGPQADISRFGDGSVLVIGLLDAQTRKPIWIAATKAPVGTEYLDPEAQQQLKVAVRRAFERLDTQR